MRHQLHIAHACSDSTVSPLWDIKGGQKWEIPFRQYLGRIWTSRTAHKNITCDLDAERLEEKEGPVLRG